MKGYLFLIFAAYSQFWKQMKQTKRFLIRIIIGLLLMPLISSCVDNQRDLQQESAKLPKDQYFDFNINQNVTLNIDFCFKDYFVLFEIYSQNPIEADTDGSWKKKEIEPLYGASTDMQGKFSGELMLPSDISEVWLLSDYLGTVSPVKLAINNQSISFNQNTYIQKLLQQANSKTRGVTAKKHKYLEEWTLLDGVDWDNNGRPNNLLPEVKVPPVDVLYNIKYVFRKGNSKNISDNHPEFFNGTMTSDVPIIKNTKISLAFVSSSAGFHNTVGYYTYPTGETPTASNVKKILAFPNASPIFKSENYKDGIGALVCGEEIQLKYWDGEKYVDEFPKGVTIGWCLQAMGFKNSDDKNDSRGDIVKGMGIRYSTTDLNEIKDGVKRQRTVSLRDKESKQIVAIGFEDNIDNDYADAIFYIRTSEKDAVDNNVPELPEDPTPPANVKNTTSYSGTLTFEDLWPKEGDYDMNDVMIRYTSTVYRMVLTNKVFQIVDKFSHIHRGGYLVNGFGYQFHHLSSSDIKDIKIKYPSGISGSKHMTPRGELEQSHPTIILLDHITALKNKEDTITVTTLLNDVDEKKVFPPYNPFIFIEADKTRGQEVHLVKYPPTDKADLSLFGTGKDASRPEEGLYYVSVDLMPFALNMPSVKFTSDLAEEKDAYLNPTESRRIDVSFPKFATWVQSNGTKEKDWYKSPLKD